MEKFFKILLFFILNLLLTDLSFCQNWKYIGSSEQDFVFYDKDNISYDGNKVIACIKFVCINNCKPNYAEESKIYEKTRSYIISYEIYYCGERKSEMLMRTTYNVDGTTSEWNRNGHRVIDNEIEGSIGEMIYLYFCSN